MGGGGAGPEDNMCDRVGTCGRTPPFSSPRAGTHSDARTESEDAQTKAGSASSVVKQEESPFPTTPL